MNNNNQATMIVGCGMVFVGVMVFNLFMAYVVQQVWVFLRPEHPLPYLTSLLMWILVTAVLTYFKRGK